MRIRRTLLAFGLVTITGATSLAAQATFTPSYNAPYRAFARHEFGGIISFPEDRDWALEGQYRFGSGVWDIGLRGGIAEPAVGDAIFLVGAEGRARVITHTVDFPLDGAFILGGGFNFNGGTTFIVPVGLSLGRRLDVEDSQVSIVPYAQPTMFFAAGGGDTDLLFAFGFGGDFRLSRALDVRVSASLGDLEGVALGLVYVR
jgi:hypothetical protein